jgi:integrase
MSKERTSKRTYGAGSVFVHRGSWYGRWWVGGRRIKRKLGPIRQPGAREGLTRKQAEAALRRLMGEIRFIAPEERMTFEDVAGRYLHHLEHVRRRKPSTIHDYKIILNKHLIPHLGTQSIERIRPDDIASYLAVKLRHGLAIKTVTNHLNFAHGVFAFAVKRGWALSNPVAATDRPRAIHTDPDIRFLDLDELEALLRATAGRNDLLAPTDHALCLTAATTGLRQGELIALRWRDVDWFSSVVRVRRNYTRGEWGTPKSRRSSRATPMADRLGAELERHYQRSLYQGDDHLVFCHPHTGHPYDASKIRKRFYQAMRLAGMAERCGHKGGITFHSLRHTYGTRMAAVNTPMRTLQEWMGHRDLRTTEIYADYAPDAARGAALTEMAFGAGSGEETLDPGCS